MITSFLIACKVDAAPLRQRPFASAAFSKQQLLALFGKRLWGILLIFFLPPSSWGLPAVTCLLPDACLFYLKLHCCCSLLLSSHWKQVAFVFRAGQLWGESDFPLDWTQAVPSFKSYCPKLWRNTQAAQITLTPGKRKLFICPQRQLLISVSYNKT